MFTIILNALWLSFTDFDVFHFLGECLYTVGGFHSEVCKGLCTLVLVRPQGARGLYMQSDHLANSEALNTVRCGFSNPWYCDINAICNDAIYFLVLEHILDMLSVVTGTTCRNHIEVLRR